MSLDVAILVAGEPPAALATHHAGYGSMIEQLLRRQDARIRCTHYTVLRDEFPADPGAHDAYVISGSRHGAYDPLPWIARLSEFIRQLDARRRPLAGICFGHQLIAQALGGRVEKAQQGWGIGVHRAGIAARAPWMRDAAPEFALIVSHQDQVVELPPRAEVLAGSGFCPVALYRIDGHVFGVQGHPEFSAGFARELLHARRGVIDDARLEAGLASLDEPADSAEVARWLVEFLHQQHHARAC